jgi:hypothetical protein
MRAAWCSAQVIGIKSMYYLMQRVYRVCPEFNWQHDIEIAPRAVPIERGSIDEMIKLLLSYKTHNIGYFIADYWIER